MNYSRFIGTSIAGLAIGAATLTAPTASAVFFKGVNTTTIAENAPTSSAGAQAILQARASSSLGANTSVGLNASATVSVTLTPRFKNMQTRANEEIDRRINALNALAARVNAMQMITSSDQSSLSAAIQAQINALNALKTQVGVDAQANNTSSLITDVKSITGSYRTFVLIIPQGAIEAAADRIMNVANIMTNISAAFSARLSEAETMGNNITAAMQAYTDFNAKIKDANIQAQAATTAVASLKPDGGVSTVMQANTSALQAARAKIKAGQQDLIAARQDANAIIKALASFTDQTSVHASTTANASATVTATTSAQ